MRRILFVFLAVLPLSSVADMNCQSRYGDKIIRIAVHRTHDIYSSSAWLNDVELKSVGPCWLEKRPGTRYLRCSNQSADGTLRLDINVWSETTSGDMIRSKAVMWDHDQPSVLSLEQCSSP